MKDEEEVLWAEEGNKGGLGEWERKEEMGGEERDRKP